ncbi:MAG TPA: hypothetical protein VGE52_10490, partial [Pirellulales bacterium]
MRITNWLKRWTAGLAVGIIVAVPSPALPLRAAEPGPAPSSALAEPVRGTAQTADRRAAEGEPDSSRRRTDEFVQ